MAQPQKERTMTKSINEGKKNFFEQKSRTVEEKMQEVLKEALAGDSLQDKLSDGTALCKLVNSLKPGCLRQYHRKPRSLMMKLENIGFFLQTAKTRFNVPQTSLFAPQDLQDKTDDNANMIRVLNVITLVFKEMGINIESDAPELEETLKPVSSTPQTATTTTTTATKPTTKYEEEEIEEPRTPRDADNGTQYSNTTSDSSKNFEKVDDKPTPIPTPTPVKVIQGSWYIQSKLQEYVDIQPEVTNEILECIHNELSIESKLALLAELAKQENIIQDKLLYASNDELRQICFETGLGSSLDDVPPNKDRKWYVEWIVKYGRVCEKK